VLASRRDVSDIASLLRAKAFDSVGGLTGTLSNLASLGINTSGYDNSLTLSDETALSEALSSNLSGVKSLFTQDTTGIASRLSTYIQATAGEDGTIATTETNLSKQSTSIDSQIAAMEKIVESDTARMKRAFAAMETAQAKISQQSSYLTSKFG